MCSSSPCLGSNRPLVLREAALAGYGMGEPLSTDLLSLVAAKKGMALHSVRSDPCVCCYDIECAYDRRTSSSIGGEIISLIPPFTPFLSPVDPLCFFHLSPLSHMHIQVLEILEYIVNQKPLANTKYPNGIIDKERNEKSISVRLGSFMEEKNAKMAHLVEAEVNLSIS